MIKPLKLLVLFVLSHISSIRHGSPSAAWCLFEKNEFLAGDTLKTVFSIHSGLDLYFDFSVANWISDHLWNRWLHLNLDPIEFCFTWLHSIFHGYVCGSVEWGSDGSKEKSLKKERKKGKWVLKNWLYFSSVPFQDIFIVCPVKFCFDAIQSKDTKPTLFAYLQNKDVLEKWGQFDQSLLSRHSSKSPLSVKT